MVDATVKRCRAEDYAIRHATVRDGAVVAAVLLIDKGGWNVQKNWGRRRRASATALVFCSLCSTPLYSSFLTANCSVSTASIGPSFALSIPPANLLLLQSSRPRVIVSSVHRFKTGLIVQRASPSICIHVETIINMLRYAGTRKGNIIISVP